MFSCILSHFVRWARYLRLLKEQPYERQKAGQDTKQQWTYNREDYGYPSLEEKANEDLPLYQQFSPETIYIYVDGSFGGSDVGVGVFFGHNHCLNFSAKIDSKIGCTNSTDVEILAVILALTRLKNWDAHQDQKIVIRTDAKNVVLGLNKKPLIKTTKNYEDLFQSVLVKMAEFPSNVEIEVQWIRGHQYDEPANLIADQLAKIRNTPATKFWEQVKESEKMFKYESYRKEELEGIKNNEYDAIKHVYQHYKNWGQWGLELALQKLEKMAVNAKSKHNERRPTKPEHFGYPPLKGKTNDFRPLYQQFESGTIYIYFDSIEAEDKKETAVGIFFGHVHPLNYSAYIGDSYTQWSVLQANLLAISFALILLQKWTGSQDQKIVLRTQQKRVVTCLNEWKKVREKLPNVEISQASKECEEELRCVFSAMSNFSQKVKIEVQWIVAPHSDEPGHLMALELAKDAFQFHSSNSQKGAKSSKDKTTVFNSGSDLSLKAKLDEWRQKKKTFKNNAMYKWRGSKDADEWKGSKDAFKRLLEAAENTSQRNYPQE